MAVVSSTTRYGLILLLAVFGASAQVSYFNQGFLRQGNAALDRAYLGIVGTNAVPIYIAVSSPITAVTNAGPIVVISSPNWTNNDILVSNALYSAIVAATNSSLVAATNNDTVVSNGVVAHTVTMAGTSGRITSSVGTAQSLSSNPSSTFDLATVGTAGTYYKTTFDAYGRETSGVTTVAVGDIAGGSIGGLILGNGSGTPTWYTPPNVLFLVDDFDANQTGNGGTTPWTVSNSGTGAGAATQAGTAGHPGIMLHNGPSSSTTGDSIMYKNSSGTRPYLFGNGVFKFEWVFMLPYLSDNTTNYLYRVGMTDVTSFTSSGNPNNCVVFDYSNNTNSGKFLAKLRAASGTVNVADTGLTVVANTWYRLGAVVNAGATSVDFYTNGVLSVTIAATAPSTTGNEVSPISSIIKFAGASQVAAQLDLYYHFCALTTSR